MHLRYSPSGAKRWMKCPGSLNVVRSEGDNNTAYSARGTILHTLAENCVRFDTDPARHYMEDIDGYTVTREDVDHVQAYKQTIGGVLFVDTPNLNWKSLSGIRPSKTSVERSTA